MNVFKRLEYRSSPTAAAISLPVGVALFFMVRFLESLGSSSMAVNVLVEEASKIAVFAAVALAARSRIFESTLLLQSSEENDSHGIRLLIPLLCIVVFAITENVLYFLRFPTSSIYRRLLYAYPIHINTALLYALAFLSGGALRTALYFLLGVAYHLGLNHLSADLQVFLIYTVGVGNLFILFLLYWRVRMKIVQRSAR
jgi:hypothetical protein